MRTIKTRQSNRTIKTFQRTDRITEKTKNGLSDANRTAEQLDDANAESGVDYAGSRIQAGEGQVGEYSAYGLERIGWWGLRVTGSRLNRAFHRSRRLMQAVNPRRPRHRLPIPNRKRLLSAKKMLNAPSQTAKGSVKKSQKAMMTLKRNMQNAVRYTQTFIKSLVKAIKATVAVLKETVVLIIAGGWVAALVIVIICLAAIVGGKLTRSL